MILGHLSSDKNRELSPTLELEADTLAFEIVTQFFSENATFPQVRAMLCAFMFLSLNQMWEQTVYRIMSAEGREFSITTHPAYEQQIEHFVSHG